MICNIEDGKLKINLKMLKTVRKGVKNEFYR